MKTSIITFTNNLFRHNTQTLVSPTSSGGGGSVQNVMNNGRRGDVGGWWRGGEC